MYRDPICYSLHAIAHVRVRHLSKYDSDYSVLISAVDNGVDPLGDDESFTIVVGNTNREPIVVGAEISTNVDVEYNGQLSANDADGDALTFSIDQQPMLGVVEITDPSTGVFTYTPNASVSGSDSFAFVATDGDLVSDGESRVRK